MPEMCSEALSSQPSFQSVLNPNLDARDQRIVYETFQGHCLSVTAMAECECAMLADPFLNDENFLLCVLSLEELGATGNKVLHQSPSI